MSYEEEIDSVKKWVKDSAEYPLQGNLMVISSNFHEQRGRRLVCASPGYRSIDRLLNEDP